MIDEYEIALTNAVVANLRRLYWYYDYLFHNDGFNNHDDLLDIGKDMARIQAALDVLNVDTSCGVYNQYAYQKHQTPEMTEEQEMEIFSNRIQYMYLPDMGYEKYGEVLTPVTIDRLWLEIHTPKEVK